MTNPQAPFQMEQSATQHTEALVRAEGMLGTVELHGGQPNHHRPRKRRGPGCEDTLCGDPGHGHRRRRSDQADNHGERPSGSGRRTTDGDSRYDSKAPNPFSVSFLAKDLDGFRNVAQSVEAAKPAELAAIEPRNPEKRRPSWRRGAFWSMAALAVVFCCLMNSCGSVSDDSATESMPDVVGMDYAHVHQALADYHDVDYIDLKGNPTLSGVATKQSPKAGAKVSHSTGITVTLDPQGKTKEQKEQELSKRVADCKDKDAATVIAGLDADKLTGTIRTSSNDPADMADTIRGSIAQGTAYIVTYAIVDNGKIDLVVDTVAHHNRELASQQIPAMCEAAGKQAHPYGVKVPLFSDNSGVVFSDDMNWFYSFEANITNAFGAVVEGVPITCTGTLTGQNIVVSGIN